MNISRRSLLAMAPALAVAETRLRQKVRLGLIGLSAHASEILQPLRHLPDVEFAAVAENDPKLLSEVKQFAGAQHYSDYRTMLDRERLDVVGICNQNGERAQAILDSASRRINVIAEKPLAVTASDLVKIKNTVAKSGIRLGMLLPMRFDSPFLALRQIVQSGQIGEVALIAAQKSYIGPGRAAWFMRKASYGSTIPWIGPHMVDLMRWTSGREMTEVLANQTHIGYPELGDMETVASLQFRLDNGGAATLNMDYLRPRSADTSSDDRLRLAGTKGVVEYQQRSGVLLMVDGAKPERVTQLPEKGSVFVDYLQGIYGDQPSTLTLADVYRVTDIVLRAAKSAEEKRVLSLR